MTFETTAGDNNRSSLPIIGFDLEESSTVLAALRYYQENGQGDPDNRSDAIHDIATNGGEVMSSLDDEGIDDLCERINCVPDARLEAQIAGLLGAKRLATAAEHTAEPWTASDYAASLASGPERGACLKAGDDTILDLPFDGAYPEALQRANARRIAACINACAGLSTEYLESLAAAVAAGGVSAPGSDA